MANYVTTTSDKKKELHYCYAYFLVLTSSM